MRSRSPSRRSTPPPPPRISRRSPDSFRMRGKSPDRRRRMAPPPGVTKFPPVGSRSGSPPRPRDHRRDFRHSPRRRSRSPLQRESKVRSYSPGKRKVSPPKRERVRSRDTDRERMRSRESDREGRPPHADMPPPRKRTRSKSRESAPRDASRTGSYGGPSEVSPARTYQGLSGPYPPEDATRTMSERFHGSGGPGGFKKESENPVFRGPDGTSFDINELKKITVDVRRNIPVGMDPIERTIINPEDVVLVRRPEMLLDDREFGMMQREGQPFRGRYDNEAPPPSSSWSTSWECEINNYVHSVSKREGSRPIFARDEIMQATRVNTGTTIEEHRRVVAIVDEAPPVELQGGLRSLPHADDRDNGDYPRTAIARFESPGHYSDAGPRSRDGYYPPPSEREAPPRDYTRPTREYDRPPPTFEQRERSRDDRFDRHSDDLRHELEMRRRDDRYEPRRYDRNIEYRGGESGRSPSDLRLRINEKRTDHHDEREPAHHRAMEHYPDPRERQREQDPPRRGMMQPSPPGSERRRGLAEEFGHPGDDRRMHGSGDGRQGPPERFHHEPPDRFHYKSWDSNPEHVPKGRAYFEHDNRGEEFVRGRGRGMIGRGYTFRGRMMRGRPFRGAGPPTRGFMGNRGSRRGYSPSKSPPHSPRDRHFSNNFERLDNRRPLHRR